MYDGPPDPYCYPETSVLRNKADIRDLEELADFETAMSTIRADEPLPEGALDYSHYRAIHRHLFQDVYDWAGEPRTVRLAKGGNAFCYPEYIDREMARLFSELEERQYLQGLDKHDFAKEAAHFLAELNAIHPFREGNGRTQMIFLLLLGERAGNLLVLDTLDEAEMMSAMIQSFSGDEAPLAVLIEKMIADP